MPLQSTEGEGAPIKEKTLYTYNLKKNKIESKKPFCLAEYEYKGKTKAVGFHTKSSDSRKYDNDTEYTQYNDDYKDEYPEEYRESWGEKIYGENGQHRIAMDAIETTIDDLAFEVSNIGKIYRTPEEAIQEAMELVKIAMEDMVRGIENEALTSLEEDEEHINTKRELCESIQQREK